LAEAHDFSEDNLKHLHGFDTVPCYGGNVEMSTAYLSLYQGPISEGDDPFDPSPASAYCTDCDPVRYVDNVVFLPVRATTSDNDYMHGRMLRSRTLLLLFHPATAISEWKIFSDWSV
jgi:C1A family cysteine protease